MAACDMEKQPSPQHQQEQDLVSSPVPSSPISEGFMQKFRLYQTLSVIMCSLFLGLIRKVKYIDEDQRAYGVLNNALRVVKDSPKIGQEIAILTAFH